MANSQKAEFPDSEHKYFTTCTVSGRPVIIYNIYGGGPQPVHGAYLAEEQDNSIGWWIPLVWSLQGKRFDGGPTDLDLAVSFAG